MNQLFHLETVQSFIGIAWAVMGIITISKNEHIEQCQKGYSLALIVTFSLPMLQCVRDEVFPSLWFLSVVESRSIAFLYGPFLYLYVKKILNEPVKGFKKKIFHFIPFLVFYLLEFFVMQKLTHSVNKMPVMRENASYLGNNPFIYIHSALSAVSVLVYGIVIYKRIVQYEKNVDHHFSSHETDITLSWLRNLAMGYIVLFGLSFFILFLLSPIFIKVPFSITRIVSPQLITNIPLSLFILYFSIYSTGQKTIVIDEIKNASETKYKKSTISEVEMIALISKLKEYMYTSKIYLDPELTLEILAKNIEMTRHIVSQVLNEGLHVAFYTFINRLRIAEFENLIKQNKHKSLSIMGLAFECGFRSSSSFYNALKKERGKTPKQLIKEITVKSSLEESA
jgi:AraC-like DNA-binding protein